MQRDLKLPRMVCVKIITIFGKHLANRLFAKWLGGLWVVCRTWASVNHCLHTRFIALLLAGHSRSCYATALSGSQHWLPASFCTSVLPWKPVCIVVHQLEELTHRARRWVAATSLVVMTPKELAMPPNWQAATNACIDCDRRRRWLLARSETKPTLGVT